MDIRQLKYFLMLSEELHFRRAALKLHISQPALTQQMRNLERKLKVELFTRSSSGVDLTPAGVALQGHARTIVSSFEAVEESVGRVAAGVSGRLSIGFTGSATYDLLPKVAKAITQYLPEIDLELHGEVATEEQLELLRTHAIDIAFLRPPVGEGFITKRVTSDYLSILLPADHPLAASDYVDLRDTRGEAFIQYRQGFDPSTDQFVSGAFQQAGFSPIVHHEVNVTSVMVSLVAAGLGVALVPDSVRSVQVEGAVLRPLRSPVVPMGLAASWRKGSQLPVVLRFVELLDQLFPDNGN